MQDLVGTKYFALLIEIDKEGNPVYLAVAVSVDLYNQFINNEIDLRSIFINPALGEWYVSIEMKEESILFSYLPKTLLKEAYLPEVGFYLNQEKVLV
jgi:hypothetical protein